MDDEAAPGEVTPVALLVLEQKVRPEAHDTLAYFADQDVTVKVISGDNAVSVGAVTRSLGVVGDQVIDARKLPQDPEAFTEQVEGANVFGRVTPQQKRQMVSALQSRGHTVAMTGDGVNDVLAIKDSDLGVAMGSGAAATRSVAQLVLLDDSFATLPHVVAEGRRVIGNIERVANFFLTKTLYSVLLALLIAAWRLPFPFVPIHVSLVGWFTIGIPASVLALAPNAARARPGFLQRVMRFGIPAAVVIGVTTFVSYLLTLQQSPTGLTNQVSTAVLVTLLCGGAWVMITISRPYEWWKLLMIVGCIAATFAIFLVPLELNLGSLHLQLQQVFFIDTGNPAMIGTGFLLGGIAIVAIEIIWWVAGHVTHGERRRIWGSARQA
ncbi:MAG: HAD-IC family P-type ATPase [Propionicimonas sp.]